MEQEIDSRVRIRQGAQTARITVTITREQHSRLRSLCRGSGFNASEVYDNRRESVPGEGESRA